ncbi:polysaccharide biosynthesis tyrosine autokinase [Planctomicrobium sp. SH527]|uniref:polysaccharide biosynthesis tyrosine autokinase n=1 Tax=Planctomicrobium sp. SH527 TaxID=3448123 RepID=UPI003F5C811A
MSTATVDFGAIFRKQAPMIIFCGVLGILMAVIYWANAEVWYESKAKMLVTLKDMRGGSQGGDTSWGNDRIQDEILANHMEIVSSRRIIGNALERVNWSEMEGLQSHLKEDQDSVDHAIDYVVDRVSLTKGGRGSAKNARSLNLSLRHTNPEECLLILHSLVVEYEKFLDEQVTRVMSEANQLIQHAQEKIESDLKQLEASYVEARQKAPILYSGEQGASNVYMDKFRRLQDELVTVEIERSAVETRHKNVLESIQKIKENNGDKLELIALIDSDSLQRLGTFAGFSSAQTSEFQQSQVSRIKDAETRYGRLTSLKAELSRLESNFGPSHPNVENLRKEIKLVENLLQESAAAEVYAPLFDKLTPELLLRAYTGFLRNDLETLNQRKTQLDALAMDAEEKSKSLVEFELKDRMIQSEITRKQALYDGVVSQLRELDTATGLSGYVHEVLEDPQLGQKVWPSLILCGASGLLLGLCLGTVLAFANDHLDNRFRSPSEIAQVLGVPVIAQVGKINHSRDRKRSSRFIVDAQAPEAEAFRLMRTYLLKEVKSGNLRTAMVTSSQPKDGKSTILVNLGASFAELGLKVLIIDGDMRAPTVHRFMNFPIDVGLSEFLQEKAELADIVRETGIEGFYLMSAGGAVRNPAELLQSERFDELLSQCKQNYDMVLVDSGPVLLVSDPAIVSQKCDISLLVIRPSVDTKRKVAEAVSRLRSSRSNLRGCILNTYGSTKEFLAESGYGSSYYGYGYGYGNRGYGRRRKDGAEEVPRNGHASSESESGKSPAGPRISS